MQNENKLLLHDMCQIHHWHVDSKNEYGNEYAKHSNKKWL